MGTLKIAMVAGLAALSFSIYDATSADARGRSGVVIISPSGYQAYVARRYYTPRTYVPNVPPSDVLPQPPVNRAVIPRIAPARPRGLAPY